MKERKLTGYPSIDKPWLKYYEGKISGEMLVPGGTVYDFLWQNNSVHPKDIALRYFWRKIDYRKLFSKIDDVERALTAYGVKAGEIVTIVRFHPFQRLYIYSTHWPKLEPSQI